MRTVVSAVSILLLLPTLAAAQLFEPSRNYKVYEYTKDFFFQPDVISPLSTGAFDEVMGSFSDHRLSAISRNPANLKQIDGSGYFYADVQTLPSEETQGYYPCAYCYYPMSSLSIYVPSQSYDRKSEQPFFSSAFFIRPFESEAFTFGLSYKLMSLNTSFQDPLYDVYPYPENVLASTDSYYRGNYFTATDEMNTIGHFPSLYLGYTWTENLSTGLEVSYISYRTNGQQVSDGFGELSLDPYPEENNYNRNRDNNYDHWDITAGLNYTLSDKAEAGISLGYILGDYNQGGDNTRFIDYENTYDNGYNIYTQEYQERRGFDRDGSTFYTTLEYTLNPRKDRTIRMVYQGSWTRQDLGYGLREGAQTFNEGEYTNSQEQTVYQKNNIRSSAYTEARGDRSGQGHQLAINLSQKLDQGYRLQLGLQTGIRSIEEASEELTIRSSFNDGVFQPGDVPPSVIDSETQEQASLDFTQRFNEFSLFVPLMLSKSFGTTFEASLGIMGSYRSLIFKEDYLSTSNTTQRYLENGEEITDTYAYTNRYGDRRQDSQSHFNAFGTISYRPGNQVQFTLTTFSDRRDLSRYRSINGIGFQLGMEVDF